MGSTTKWTFADQWSSKPRVNRAFKSQRETEACIVKKRIVVKLN